MLLLVTYKACGCTLEIPQVDAKEEIERASDGEICPKCRAGQPKTLAEHLAAARDKRNPEKLREHADRIRRLPRKVKPCNCGRTDDTHKSNCPVYFRQLRQNKKESGQ